MKYLLKSIFSFSLLTMAVHTKAEASCGTYLVRAEVIMKDGVSSLVINPGTRSEINLKVAFNESMKLSPYIGRLIETNATIKEKMDFTRGMVAILSSISPIAPDPLSQSKGTKFELLKKEDCQ